MFDFTRDYAYKIMNATRVYNLLKGHFKPSELPKAETHCRPLCKIEKDEDVLAIWENVVTTNKIIAKTVIEMVNQHLGKGKVTPEPETVTETGTDTASGSVESGVEGDELTAVQELKIARARITELENDLEKARSVTGGIAKTKMAREMIQKGFAVLAGTCTDDQKTELIATKKALLG
ncbi:MAG: hypothetical protein GY861_04245 [bacterium]|nr:hypothetical protein [bacterium]